MHPPPAQLLAILLMDGVDVNAPVDWGEGSTYANHGAGHSPLFTAMLHHCDDMDVVRLLLEQGAHLNPEADGGIFATAVEKGNPEDVVSAFQFHVNALAGLQGLPSFLHGGQPVMHTIIDKVRDMEMGTAESLMRLLNETFHVSMLTKNSRGQTAVRYAWNSYHLSRHDRKSDVARFAEALEAEEVGRNRMSVMARRAITNSHLGQLLNPELRSHVTGFLDQPRFPRRVPVPPPTRPRHLHE